MPPHPLSVAVARALDVLVEEGAVPWRGELPGAEEADDARVARTATGYEYATSLPLRVAGRASIPAHQLAGLLAARISREPGVRSARVAGGGYVEVDPDPAGLLRTALDAGAATERPAHGALDPLAGGDPGAEVCHAVAEVGADAVRFALARRATGAVTLDLDLLGRADERNPVYAVQLAHARLAGVLRRAEVLGVAPAATAEEPAELAKLAAEVLEESPARELVAAVAQAAPVTSRALRLRRPDLVVRHLSATADAAHDYLTTCRVLPAGDELPDRRHRTRLRLALAARDTLAHGLDLIGASAPERM